MRVLGIDIVSNDLCWVGLEGNIAGGTLLLQSPNKLNFPSAAISEFGNLMHLKELVVARLSTGGFQKVGIVKAGVGSSALRAKCEFVIELACHEVGTEWSLVPPQTVSAAEKRKIAAATGSSLSAAFNKGQEIQPKYLARAAACAWCAIS